MLRVCGDLATPNVRAKCLPQNKSQNKRLNGAELRFLQGIHSHLRYIWSTLLNSFVLSLFNHLEFSTTRFFYLQSNYFIPQFAYVLGRKFFQQRILTVVFDVSLTNPALFVPLSQSLLVQCSIFFVILGPFGSFDLKHYTMY